MKIIIKKSLKFAVGISIGTTIGYVILPRLLQTHSYDEYPPLFLQLLMSIFASYISAFLVFLCIECIKEKWKS